MTTNNEDLFGQVAVELGFIDDVCLEECLALQRSNEFGWSLGLVMIEEGVLEPEQVNEILGEQRRRRNSGNGDAASASASLFGRILIQRGMVAEADLEGVCTDQKEFRARGYRFRLGQLLQNKGLISAAQMNEVLGLQEKELAVCPRCLVAFNFSFADQSSRENCNSCGGELVRPRFE